MNSEEQATATELVQAQHELQELLIASGLDRAAKPLKGPRAAQTITKLEQRIAALTQKLSKLRATKAGGEAQAIQRVTQAAEGKVVKRIGCNCESLPKPKDLPKSPSQVIRGKVVPSNSEWERRWRAGTPQQKRKIGEEIGEAGMDGVAQKRGYEPVWPPKGTGRGTRPQGFDAIFRDPKSGQLVIGEAKGGYSGKSLDGILGSGYGYQQATKGWAKEAAKKMIKSGGDAEARKAARLVEREIAKGNLRIEVFHTPHQAGVPGPTTLHQTFP